MDTTPAGSRRVTKDPRVEVDVVLTMTSLAADNLRRMLANPQDYGVLALKFVNPPKRRASHTAIVLVPVVAVNVVG